MVSEFIIALLLPITCQGWILHLPKCSIVLFLQLCKEKAMPKGPPIFGIWLWATQCDIYGSQGNDNNLITAQEEK